MERVPVVEGLFTEDGGGKLLACRCHGCSTVYFPKATICHNPQCDDSRIEDFVFGGRGTLWSYAFQDFPPPPPHQFDPPYEMYAVGAVDFPEGVRLMGQMSVESFDDLEVGSEVELVIEPLFHQDGKAYTSWKFKPVAG